jgi:hypothetical protein
MVRALELQMEWGNAESLVHMTVVHFDDARKVGLPAM